MVLDSSVVVPASPSVVSALGLNSSKILTTKIEEIPDRIISVHLLFKNKLSVTLLGLYAGVSAKTHFFQASSINSLSSKTVNTSSFVVFGSDFNEDGFKRCASFKKCLKLGLVNSLIGFSLSKSSTWNNLHGVLKTIDYVFVSDILASAIVGCEVTSVFEIFDTDHEIVGILVGLRGLVNAHLNNLKIKNVDVAKWVYFKELSSARLAMFLSSFLIAKKKGDLDEI
ncbi:hypothetical protein G9A89_006260 [Geosiphon pyriformis]|nr:hypothetical protein G9A89_006260 [Geosiphon pyriformis]